jgi:cytochrome c biogenesis factor
MKMLSKKGVILSTLLTTGLLVSTTTSAQEVSLETAISQAVLMQGKQLFNDMSVELTKNIKQEINEFSIEAKQVFSLSETEQSNVVAKKKVKPQQSTKAE